MWSPRPKTPPVSEEVSEDGEKMKKKKNIMENTVCMQVYSVDRARSRT